jgi:hypothetical protein
MENCGADSTACSFELKGSTKSLDEQFVAEFCHFRPMNWDSPLASIHTEKLSPLWLLGLLVTMTLGTGQLIRL